MTQNIFEGARGDMLFINRELDAKNAMQSLMSDQFTVQNIKRRRYATKAGKWMANLYNANQEDLSTPQWIAVTLLVNSMIEFILVNMIKNGRFKFPGIFKYPKVFGFFKKWITELVKVFTDKNPSLPQTLLPKPINRKA